ncbi:hypothetical protein MKW98_004067 [Papaver atlanticum]|uniref:Uncharacterized protein n=1 Tax=Papaver atlanticum TaxID=357466 RepID=A0AAD4T285_9MAGN|nr:hypothetical protein MKW98_004067 [Papaver atlanticum]
MARKGINVVICIAAVVVMVMAIAQHQFVEAAPGFGDCHGKCTDDCIVNEHFDKPFCLLKCDNFCADHLNADNKQVDTDKNTVADAMAIENAEENH